MEGNTLNTAPATAAGRPKSMATISRVGEGVRGVRGEDIDRGACPCTLMTTQTQASTWKWTILYLGGKLVLCQYYVVCIKGERVVQVTVCVQYIQPVCTVQPTCTVQPACTIQPPGTL